MNKHNVFEFKDRETISDALTDMLRTGAQQFIHQAVQVEFMSQYSGRLNNEGKAAVVRNGYQPEREILTGIGSAPVKIPKVRAKDGKPVTFHSALVPPYVKKARSVEVSLLGFILKGSRVERWAKP